MSLCNTRIIVEQINIKQHKFIWNDREFQTLSECTITSIKTHPYRNNNNLKILRKQRIFVLVTWENLRCTQIIFQEIKAREQINIQGDREFQALSEYIIAFEKRLF